MLGTAGCTFVMGVPGSDDIMLNYQSTSFHDALYVRRALGLKPAPEFDAWLRTMGIFAEGDPIALGGELPAVFNQALLRLADHG
jgi:ethanolamine ammonia-lyase large subunit